MEICTVCGKDKGRLTFGTEVPLCPECQRSPGASPAELLPNLASSSPKSNPIPLSLTTILVGINLAVFAAMALTGVSVLEPSLGALIRWGADWGPLSLGSQPWRLLTSNYVHIGILHIFFNMWCLWSLGALAQRIFDRWTYLLVYTLCGLAGSCVSLWWHPAVVGAGASGAIFGLAGALLAALYLGKLNVSKDAIRPTLKSLLSFAGWNLLYGMRSGVDNSAHLGGLVAGLLLGAVFAKVLTADEESRISVRTTVFVAGAAVILASTLALRHQYAYPKNVPSIDEYVAASDRVNKELREQDFKSAIDDLQKIAMVNPRLAEAHYLLGSAYLGAHQPDDALKSFQTVLRLDPKNADAEVGLGEAYAAKHMNAEAQEAYRRAAALSKHK